MLGAILPRRAAGRAAEDGGKVVAVREADGVGDFLDAHLRGDEEGLRQTDAQRVDILAEILARIAVKQPAQIGHAAIKLRGERIQRDRRGVIARQIVRHAGEQQCRSGRVAAGLLKARGLVDEQREHMRKRPDERRQLGFVRQRVIEPLVEEPHKLAAIEMEPPRHRVDALHGLRALRAVAAHADEAHGPAVIVAHGVDPFGHPRPAHSAVFARLRPGQHLVLPLDAVRPQRRFGFQIDAEGIFVDVAGQQPVGAGVQHMVEPVNGDVQPVGAPQYIHIGKYVREQRVDRADVSFAVGHGGSLHSGALQIEYSKKCAQSQENSEKRANFQRKARGPHGMIRA